MRADLHLVLNGLHDGGMVVPHDECAVSCLVIDDLVSVHVVLHRALGARDIVWEGRQIPGVMCDAIRKQSPGCLMPRGRLRM